jgi:hypothetical protein
MKQKGTATAPAGGSRAPTRKTASAKRPAKSGASAPAMSGGPPPGTKAPRAPVTIGSKAVATATEAAKVPGVQLKPGQEVRCSFCEGSNFEREILIQSQVAEVLICDECVEICRDIVGIHRTGPRAT